MKVSVIIPVFNVEKYIDKCLKSIVNQTLADIEIICIDDCGTDNSIRIVENYALKDERITIIYNSKNRGLSTSRNLGLQIAQGKYVYFLDSDDYLEENALEDLYNISEKNQTEVLYFDTDVMNLGHYENGCNGYEPPAYSKNQKIQSGQALFSNAIINNTWDTCVWRQFYLKEFLMKNNIRFADGLAHEDWSFSFETAMLATRVMYVPLKLHMYVRRENSITDRTNWHRLVSLMKIFVIMHSIWNKIECPDYVHNCVIMHLDNLKEYIQQNYKKIPYIDQMMEILKYQRVAIYGAAELGTQLYYMLTDIGVEIETFLVTDKVEHDSIENIPVNIISKYDESLKNQGLILIAVRKSYDIMRDYAEKLGFKNILIVKTKKED